MQESAPVESEFMRFIGMNEDDSVSLFSMVARDELLSGKSPSAISETMMMDALGDCAKLGTFNSKCKEERAQLKARVRNSVLGIEKKKVSLWFDIVEKNPVNGIVARRMYVCLPHRYSDAGVLGFLWAMRGFLDSDTPIGLLEQLPPHDVCTRKAERIRMLHTILDVCQDFVSEL